MRNPFSSLGKQARAGRANARGQELDRQGLGAQAIADYERAISLAPRWWVPCYNLGLVYKYGRQWELSLQQNQRAVELDASQVAAWWNLGIAATALDRWQVARLAWRAAGVSLPDGEGPIDYPCGVTPVRLNPETAGEVVWAERLDPARALIKSIPLPEAGFRHGDIVLNDGAAKGYRKLGKEEVPVLDCLDLLRPSSFSTYVAELDLGLGSEAAQPSPIELLVELAAERQLAAEDWSTGLRILCQACSEGRPHADHDHQPDDLSGPRRVAIAAPKEEHARALLSDWLPRSRGATLLSLERALLAAAL